MIWSGFAVEENLALKFCGLIKSMLQLSSIFLFAGVSATILSGSWSAVADSDCFDHAKKIV